jgi:hypothetical protein
MTGRRKWCGQVMIAAWLGVLAFAPSAWAKIVYAKGFADTAGAKLVAMNDDGSGAHTLLSAAQVPPNDRLAYPSLQPNSSTLVFEGFTDKFASVNGENSGDDGANYGGLYVMSGGAVTRLSSPPAAAARVGSEDTSPSLTADGRVVYEHLVVTFDSAGNPTGSAEQLLVRPITGGAPSTWSTSPPASFLTWSADPANAGLLAYVNEASPPELQIGNENASSTNAVVAQPAGTDPAWSPDGSYIVDADWTTGADAGTDGFSAGLWLLGHNAVRELLVDPDPPVFSTHPGTFANPVFVGSGEIAFAATVNNVTNIYEIPMSCNKCTFPGPQVHQLTTDGTASSPDWYPAWTSRTIAAFGQGHTPKLSVSVTAPARQQVLKHRSLVESVTCNVACAFAAIGEVRIRGMRQPLPTKSGTGKLAAKHTLRVRLPLSTSQLRKIARALKHHTKVTAELGAVAQDASGKRRQATTSFTVRH